MTEPITHDASSGAEPPPPGTTGGDAPGESIEGGDEFRRNRGLGLALLAALGLWAWLGGGFSLLAVILAIGVMIFFHELGHFLTAKSAGMKVTEFFLGFGPRIWSFQRGETEYGIKALPFGAYVKIIGMTRLDPVDPGDESRTYWSKPYWRRFSVAVAGSTMHFIMAIIGIWAVLSFSGGVGGTIFPSNADANTNASYSLRVAHVDNAADRNAPEPAFDAGLKTGDKLVEVDGQPVSTFADARTVIKAHPDETVPVTVERDGEQVTLDVHLARNPTDSTIGYLGVSPKLDTSKENALVAVPLAFQDFGRGTVETFKGLGRAFSPSSLGNIASDVASSGDSGSTASSSTGTGGSSASNSDSQVQDRPISIIGAARIGSELTRDNGWVGLVLLMIELNLFLGIFNLLPILPLDGGHIAIATYEKIRSMMQKGKPYYADITKLIPVTYGVVAAMLIFGVTLMYLDVRQIGN